MPRNAHFWQVGLLDIVLSEYPDKSHNFQNFIFVTSYFGTLLGIYFLVFNASRALHLKWTGSSLSLPWATILKTLQVEECFQRECQGEHCRGKKRKRFSSCLQNLSRASSPSLVMRLTGPKILIIEETTKGLHDSYTILTLIEHDMSARLNCSLPSLVPRVFVSYYTCWLSGQRRRE